MERADFISDWEAVRRLDPFHLWTEDTVRERFDWAKRQGLHLLIVRIFRADVPIVLEPTAELAGCKSWIDVPANLAAGSGAPVLDEITFAERSEAVRRALAGG